MYDRQFEVALRCRVNYFELYFWKIVDPLCLRSEELLRKNPEYQLNLF